MKTLSRMLYRDIATATVFVTLAFVALLFFFDMVDELRRASRSDAGGHIARTLLLVLLRVPRHIHELLPITLLIGGMYVMTRLAQSSQFTIMRTSGMGPWQALRSLLGLGLGCALLTFAAGDWLAAAAEGLEQKLRAQQVERAPVTQGLADLGQGAWLKERRGQGAIAVHVRAVQLPDQLQDVRIFEFDAQGRIAARLHAQGATMAGDGNWLLHDVEGWRVLHADRGHGASAQDAPPGLLPVRAARMDWPSTLTMEMVAAARLRPERMSTLALFSWWQHLQANGQWAQKYQIEFWRKVFYPLSCLVMLVLALPFAYLHFRQGSIAGHVFGGVLAGISFFLLNNVSGYIGTLYAWPPMLAASAPGLLYSALSLSAFVWLVLRH